MSDTTETATPPPETTETAQTTTDAPTLLTGEAKQPEGTGTLAADTPAEGEVDKDNEGKAEDTPQPPEKYEFDIPEGLQLDEKLLAEADPIFRELNLTQDQANKLAGIWADQQFKQQEAWASQVKEWQGQVKSDPEIGGDKFDASIQVANETLTRFGASPEFIKFLGDFGLGNHPEMVKFMVNVGKATAEDRPAPNSGAPSSASMSEGERAYQYADKPARRSTT